MYLVTWLRIRQRSGWRMWRWLIAGFTWPFVVALAPALAFPYLMLLWTGMLAWAMYELQLTKQGSDFLAPILAQYPEGLRNHELTATVFSSAWTGQRLMTPMSRRLADAAWSVTGAEGIAGRMECWRGHLPLCGHHVRAEELDFWRAVAREGGYPA